jgi:flavodoxin
MKKLIFTGLLIFFITSLVLTGCNTQSEAPSSPAPSQSEPSKSSKSGLGKVLIVYYSFQGTTVKVVDIIKDMTGADILEIQPEFDYFREDVEEIAKQQINEGYKPDLKNPIPDVNAYDVIFIGSGVWWYSPPPPVMSFLSKCDLKNKIVVPFCTYKGATGDYFKKLKDACPGAKVYTGRDFSNSELTDMEDVKQKIEAWLKEVEKGE